MEFKSLKEKYMYYRGQVDHRLSNDEYVMVMLGGRSFSKKIKKKFKRPFDNAFPLNDENNRKELMLYLANE